MDLQAYEDPAQGALDFAQELDPTWLIVDTVIGEGKSCCDPSWSPLCGSTWLPSGSFFKPEVPDESLSAGSCILLELLCPGAASASYALCSVVMGFLIKNIKHIISAPSGVTMPSAGCSQMVPKVGESQSLPQ